MRKLKKKYQRNVQTRFFSTLKKCNTVLFFLMEYRRFPSCDAHGSVAIICLAKKTKRDWFKLCCKQLMLCVVPLDKTLYLHCISSPSLNLVPDYVGMHWCFILGESITLIGFAPRRPEINTNTIREEFD